MSVVEPPESLLAAGCAMVPMLLVPENRRAYSEWLRTSWDACWNVGPDTRGWFRWPQPPPRDRWPQIDVPWGKLTPDSSWREITSNLARFSGGDAVWVDRGSGWGLCVNGLDEESLSKLNQFF